ncbi:MAG: hypothetical protein NZ521_03770, partial [Flammeovirgaceae bacterium]|nr:hypothetical protein [Flammeovirgaceae bacterium]MDW8287306.1 hypothetical protein [Flammeovirgaceae bacterium]
EGWDRSAEYLFRHQIALINKKQVCTVVPLRVHLPEFSPTKSQQKILKKNKSFKVTVSSFAITDELRQIYNIYKLKFKSTREKLDDYFNFTVRRNFFPTKQIMVYDGDKLIAASFFDEGKYSIYSIVGIYLPEYKKYSLGIYTMLLEIEYGIKKGKIYYYPGHAVDKPSFYDYKFRFNALYYYDWKGNWKDIQHLPYEKTYIREVESHIEELKNYILENRPFVHNVELSSDLCLVVNEEFFDVHWAARNLDDKRFPLFLCIPVHEYFNAFVSYEPCEQIFVIHDNLEMLQHDITDEDFLREKDMEKLVFKLKILGNLLKVYREKVENILVKIALLLPYRVYYNHQNEKIIERETEIITDDGNIMHRYLYLTNSYHIVNGDYKTPIRVHVFVHPKLSSTAIKFVLTGMMKDTESKKLRSSFNLGTFRETKFMNVKDINTNTKRIVRKIEEMVFNNMVVVFKES